MVATRPDQVPDDRAFDQKSSSGLVDAHAGVSVDKPVCADTGQKIGADLPFIRFGGQTRGHGGESVPIHFPQVQRRAVAIGQDRVGIGVVGQNREGRVEETFRRRVGDKRTTHVTFERGEEEMRMVRVEGVRGGGILHMDRFTPNAARVKR